MGGSLLLRAQGPAERWQGRGSCSWDGMAPRARGPSNRDTRYVPRSCPRGVHWEWSQDRTEKWKPCHYPSQFLWVSLRSCKEYDQQGNDRKVTLCARLQGVWWWEEHTGLSQTAWAGILSLFISYTILSLNLHFLSYKTEKSLFLPTEKFWGSGVIIGEYMLCKQECTLQKRKAFTINPVCPCDG